MQAGAKGVKVRCAGRLGGHEIARVENLHQGQMPLHKLCADISYGLAEAHTAMGCIGVKVWIYKGDTISEVRRENVTAETSEAS
jgi:small subunit ribosomal protein S3